MASNRLERDIFGGSDSELSSEEEDLQEERYERRRLTPPPPAATKEASESSGESADEYVQEKPVKKKKIRRREDAGEGRSVQKKRKRKQVVIEEENLETLTPEQARKLQVQRQIDDIIKPKKHSRPKKSKKDAEEEALDRYADEEVVALREDMMRAAAEDDEANKEKLPGTAKLKLLPRVREILQRASMIQAVIDNNLFEGVRRWLEPLPDHSLPALNIQAFFFEQLLKTYVDTNTLKESGLGRIVLFYTKCRRVTPMIQRYAHDLVAAWSRPIIKRSASYRDRQVPLAPELDGNAPQRAPLRLNAILARAKEQEKGRVKKNAVMIPSTQLGTYSIAPRPKAFNKNDSAVANDGDRRRRAAERMKNLMKKGSAKN